MADEGASTPVASAIATGKANATASNAGRGSVEVICPVGSGSACAA